MKPNDILDPILANSLTFKSDWKRLWRLPFHRGEKSGELFKRVCRLHEVATSHPDYEWLWLAKELLLLPYSLWRIPYDGMAAYMCDVIENNGRLDDHLLLLLEFLDDLPSDEEQEMIIKFERRIQKGDYEWLVPGGAKFDAKEKELLVNLLFKENWAQLKQAYDVEKFRDRYGIVRRTPAQERNFHPKNWSDFRWDDEAYRFETTFDAFACRWMLYGVELDDPLLQKLTLNPTAVGWLGFWPAYWSPDGRRDLAWTEFNKAARARGVMRQGAKMSEGRRERKEQYKRAYLAKLEAVKKKLRGKKQFQYVISASGLSPLIDAGTYRRVIREGEKMWRAENRASKRRFVPTTAAGSPENLKAQASQSEPPTPSPQLARARSAFNDLSPEEKAEFLKSLGM